MMIVSVIILVTVNIIVLSISGKHRYSQSTLGRISLIAVSPFQNALTKTIDFAKDVWGHYFFLVSTAEENIRLKKKLGQIVQQNNQYYEEILSNIRLRSLLDFRQSMPFESIAAEVISVDPSLWYRTLVVDKGKAKGVKIGLPVVTPEGIVGQVIDTADNYSRILLIIDQDSAVDAIVQKNRARGIIKGASSNQCILKYVMRRHQIDTGDSVVSSGLDGVYPKGLPVGYVSKINLSGSELFQEIQVTPYVDFRKLEEVLVLINH